YQDSQVRIWIGTNGGGLNLLENKEKGFFRRWLFEENISSSLSSNSIYSICESTKKKGSFNSNETILWIGTNNGLNRLIINNSKVKNESVPANVKISRFILKEGLSDNSIKSIIEDDEGNLWLGTSSGITKFDTKNYTYINYSDADGIVGTDFNFSSATKNDDGKLFMGSTSGLNYFYPNDIIPSQYKPLVILTDFQIFNKSVPVNGKSPLKTNIFHSKEITLSYTQNVFSFQFAALDYAAPHSIKYAYKMEGFDDDWIYSGNIRFVTYTNLNPGEYIFKVKSSNSDGIWNDNVALIKVVISPPWWQTAWAISFYVIILVFGAWGIIKFQVNRAHLRLELKRREFESHHLREIESLKSRFFANLSHEFRTPLMLIKGPLEQLISGRIKNNLTDYYKALLRNTEKLQQLIDELLELSQLETETIPLHKQQHDLVKLLKTIVGAFIPLAEEKNITIGFNSSLKNVVAMIDRDKLEKIINNLLNNAFKFTPDGGKISVELSIDKHGKSDVATISISDTGIGIPEEHRSKIFDRFYQIDNVSKRNFGSSGIGLALVKELVSLHNWNISVFSKVREGTVFTLRIPLEKQVDETEEKSIGKLLSSSDLQLKNENLLNFNNEDIADDTDSSKKPVILFIEDSPEVRNYVFDLLNTDYEVLLAKDAGEGIQLSLKHMPDLIISDIMMDGMDGIEFCRRVKTDWQTSHIPVILLTAKATKESKIEGLVTGADDYITKPFNYEELSARIKNLIDQRKNLKEKFSKEINLTPGSIVSNDIDKGFMDKVLDALENNLNNENFDTELLAKEIFISRRQLHRKLQAVTGQAPGEFIRIFKLKRAAQMLIENRFSVTQIALEVGFGSPAQFTRAFKKYFGCLPSEFKEKCSHKFFEKS
ncbi:MAG: ATP-binding protein, partial [Ignavibacteria bacterium]|nr:ATP-binding protein [Ignavibacteria bacterium]